MLSIETFWPELASPWSGQLWPKGFNRFACHWRLWGTPAAQLPLQVKCCRCPRGSQKSLLILLEQKPQQIRAVYVSNHYEGLNTTYNSANL